MAWTIRNSRCLHISTILASLPAISKGIATFVCQSKHRAKPFSFCYNLYDSLSLSLGLGLGRRYIKSLATFSSGNMRCVCLAVPYLKTVFSRLAFININISYAHRVADRRMGELLLCQRRHHEKNKMETIFEYEINVRRERER